MCWKMSNFAAVKTYLFIFVTLTAPEYIQLRAFARYDGLILFVLWLISFIFYIIGFKWPFLGIAALVTALMTPSWTFRLVRRYCDKALSGIISFRRAWAYVVFLFFHASLLFAIVQFVYFSFIDKGFFLGQMAQMLNDPATAQAMQQMGLGTTLSQAISEFNQIRPIDLVLNIMTTNILIGLILGLPIGLIARRKEAISDK